MFVDLERNEKLRFIREKYNGSVFLHLDTVIALGHSHVHIYGHWIYDVLSPLTLFPDELIKKSYFLINRPRQLCVESLAVFGVDEEHIISVSYQDWVYAKNIYLLVDPLPHVSHFGIAFNRLTKRLHKYYRLDLIKPEKHCLGNRMKGTRHLDNFNKVVKAVTNAFPNIHFDIIPDVQGTMRETAKLWE